MARNKLIKNEILFEMIKKYLVLECNNNASKLKLPKIVQFINENGYPSYRVESLRRNPEARSYIESLKKIDNGLVEELSVTYKTLDVEAFIDNNKTRAALKKSLSNLDCYYRKIADGAVEIQRKYLDLVKKLSKQQNQKNEVDLGLQESLMKNTVLEEQIKKKEIEISKLRNIITNFVYPEIANELLAQEGILIKERNVINQETLNKNLIKPDSDIIEKEIKSGSFVISDLYAQIKVGKNE